MSDKKYLRLAGFDQTRIDGLKKKNRAIHQILDEMILQAQNMICDHTDGEVASLRAGISGIIKRAETEDVPQEIVRACYRLSALLNAHPGDCIIGRNNFLDALNIKQVVCYLTGAETRTTPLGALSRTLPPIL